jgi:hypothetical protein
MLADTTAGKHGRHRLTKQFRRWVRGRFAGYEDMNDADRLDHDSAICCKVGGRAVTRQAAFGQPSGESSTMAAISPHRDQAVVGRDARRAEANRECAPRMRWEWRVSELEG